MFDFNCLSADGVLCPLFRNNIVSYKGSYYRVVGRTYDHAENHTVSLTDVLNAEVEHEADEEIIVPLSEVVKVRSDDYINAYKIHRSYGGPEEGGWYYSVIEPITSLRLRSCESLEKIQELVKYIQESFEDELGDSLSICIEDKMGEFSPKQRPYYS